MESTGRYVTAKKRPNFLTKNFLSEKIVRLSEKNLRFFEDFTRFHRPNITSWLEYFKLLVKNLQGNIWSRTK